MKNRRTITITITIAALAACSLSTSEGYALTQLSDGDYRVEVSATDTYLSVSVSDG